jgi:hypothetical protein
MRTSVRMCMCTCMFMRSSNYSSCCEYMIDGMHNELPNEQQQHPLVNVSVVVIDIHSLIHYLFLQ